MTEKKALIILIAFCISGILFLAIGMYFKSRNFLKAMEDAAGTEEKAKSAVSSGKLCGNVALGIGGFTIVCGIITRLMPEIFSYLALVYVILLIAAFSVIFTSIKIKNPNKQQDKK